MSIAGTAASVTVKSDPATSEKEKPILEGMTRLIKERLHQGGLLPKAKLTQALHYYLVLAPYFENYLANPDARLDNNVAERAIRPITTGRKTGCLSAARMVVRLPPYLCH